MNNEHEKITYLYPHTEELVPQVTSVNNTGIGQRFIRKTIHLVKRIFVMFVWFFFTMLKPLSVLLFVLAFTMFWVTIFFTIYDPEILNLHAIALSLLLFAISSVPFFVTDKLEGK